MSRPYSQLALVTQRVNGVEDGGVDHHVRAVAERTVDPKCLRVEPRDGHQVAGEQERIDESGNVFFADLRREIADDEEHLVLILLLVVDAV